MINLQIKLIKDNIIYSKVGQVAQAERRLAMGLDGPGSILVVGRVEIFLHSFVSRLVHSTSYKRTGGKSDRA